MSDRERGQAARARRRGTAEGTITGGMALVKTLARALGRDLLGGLLVGLPRGLPRGLLSPLVGATLAACAACAAEPQPPPQATPPVLSRPAPAAADSDPDTSPVARGSTPADPWDVDLERDERRGGHTIARHVGRTDAQLQARLRRESISAASTYPDLDTAERAVRRALEENTRRVQIWMDRRAPKANLAIRHRARDGLPTGRVLGRGEPRSREVHGAVVVLRWRGEEWYVLTSYPEEPR